MPTIIHGMLVSVSGEHDDSNMVRFLAAWSAPCNTVVNRFLFVFLYSYVRNKTVEMMKEMCILKSIPWCKRD